MILLREIQERDIDTLERFSQIPGFINIPSDRDLLREKVRTSLDSFRSQKPPEDGKYIFVAEDLAQHRVVGTSMIATRHGTPDSPHFYFQVGNEEKFSETINTGFIHGTLELKHEIDGPSELGGLVIDPEIRNSELRIGRQISFVRFLFLALHRNRFRDQLLAELLPPLNKRGQSPLWEAIGRRFTNMDYWEADQLCQKNKEFILSLFPQGKIYTSFLTAEARNAIGKVGKDTEPVVHMLKKIGFEYRNQVDPFDGGPHLWAKVEGLRPLRRLSSGKLSQAAEGVRGEAGLLARLEGPQGQFRAVSLEARHAGDRIEVCDPIFNLSTLRDVLGLRPDDSVAFMPYY
jgi:arginine N-succinyltransferase